MNAQNPGTGPVARFTRDDYRRLAARIKEQRISLGWKQRELSQRAGISPDRLSRLERGASIRVDELVGVSFAFGMGIDELVFPTLRSDALEILERLGRKLLEVIPPEDADSLIRLLQVLVMGLRAGWAAAPKGDRE